MKKQILLYNIKNQKRIVELRKVLLPLKVNIKKIDSSNFAHPIGYLAGIEDMEPSDIEPTNFSEEMLVMIGFQSNDIDQLIRSFHKMKVPGIPLKAVLTKDNQYWSSYELYQELKKEHEAMK